MSEIKQPEPLKFVPERKTPRELSAERKKEIERQWEYLHTNPGAIAWGKEFPDKLKADLERLKKEVPGLKVAKKAEKVEKVEEKEEEPKDEEPKPEVEEPKEEKPEKKEVEKPKKKEKNK